MIKKNMKVSVCLTVFNEEKSISVLLESLLNQSKKADEIIIVDGGSNDNTLTLVNHFQKKDSRIKILKENCSRAKGRNLGIEIAKNEVIAVTDAGCIARKDWLEKITEPLKNKEVDIAAGFYHMTGGTPVREAMGVFLGVTSGKFDINFLPSTRSMAFRKSAWEKVGGFPESRENSAEDTDFNYNALKLGLRYARVKNAIVEWGMPESIFNFYLKIYSYAKWDSQKKIWWNPTQRFASHNIKVVLVLVRYLLGLAFLIFCLIHPPLFPILIILVLAYLLWAFRKVFLEFEKVGVALWGPILQITADFGVIIGFINGLF